MQEISLNFNPNSLIAINVMIALMMFGVSLELKFADFKRIIVSPKAPFIGLAVQFLLLPALTCLVIWLLNIDPMLSLGMLLVASCPGGAFSNIMTWLAKGNVAVSVSMTAVSSIAATILTPFNFTFYAWLNPNTRSLLNEISIDPMNLLGLVALILLVPLTLGMFVGKQYPLLSNSIKKPLKIFALAFMFILIGLAFSSNFDLFLQYFSTFFFLVVGHNLLALSIGYFSSKIFSLPERDLRAITLEVGIQNSALALVIIFTFFPQASGMLLIAAFWGVWHLISGLILSAFWSRRTILKETMI